MQETVAEELGIPKENVICHVPLLGGGFGRKSKPDYAAEAAILSKAVGRPVKVVWSREDDIKFGYYHAVAAMYMKAALDEKGKPTAWLQRSVFPPIGSTFALNDTYGSDGELGLGWTDLPFDIPNHRAENGPAENHVRIGWFRSVANIYHAFAAQSFADELAHTAGRDLLEYLAGTDRPRAHRGREGHRARIRELWRIASSLSAGHGPRAPGGRNGGGKIGVGKTQAG